MVKLFITGFISFSFGFGLCVYVTPSYWFDRLSYNQTSKTDGLHEEVWSPVTTNFKYEDEQLSQLNGFQGLPPADYKFLSATSNEALVEFTREAIDRVCIQAQYPKHADGAPPLFDAHIFLNSESRKQLGEALLSRQGKDISFRIFGLEVHNFIASKEKALEVINNPEGHNSEPDFRMLVPNHALFTGFSMFKMLLGTDTLESCDPDDPLKNFPPYVEHEVHWESIKKMATE